MGVSKSDGLAAAMHCRDRCARKLLHRLYACDTLQGTGVLPS